MLGLGESRDELLAVFADLRASGCDVLTLSTFRSVFSVVTLVIWFALHRPPVPLTPRQREVLRLLVKGYSNERIAGELQIAQNTVKQHAHAIYSALGVSTRAELIAANSRK